MVKGSAPLLRCGKLGVLSLRTDPLGPHTGNLGPEKELHSIMKKWLP